MKQCKSCKHARQVGDLTRQDVVGCVLLNKEGVYEVQVTPDDSVMAQANYITRECVRNSNIYEGYIYFGRRPGDIAKNKELGKGTLTLGLMTDARGSCDKYATLD